MKFILSLLIFRILLDLIYVEYMTKVYLHEGYILNQSYFSIIISYLIYLLSIIYCKKTYKSLGDIVLLHFPLALLGPLSSLYSFSQLGFQPLVVTLIFQIFLYYFFRLKLLKINLPNIKGGDDFIINFSILYISLMTLWYIVSGSAANMNFDLMKVYEYREVNAEKSSFGILAYFMNWGYQIINIFLISYYFINKKYFIFTIFLIIQIFFFAVSTHKSVLFYPLMVVGIIYLFNKKNPFLLIINIVNIILLLCFLLYYFMDDIILTSLLVRRVFFIPAILSHHYFDFFGSNNLIYWSNSVLSPFIDYPYDIKMTKLIGNEMGTGASANNGIVSSGYAHFSFVGIFIYFIIFAFVIKIIDGVCKNSNNLIALCISIIPIRAALISSDLLTTLLTHGLLVSLMILLFLNKES